MARSFDDLAAILPCSPRCSRRTRTDRATQTPGRLHHLTTPRNDRATQTRSRAARAPPGGSQPARQRGGPPPPPRGGRPPSSTPRPRRRSASPPAPPACAAPHPQPRRPPATPGWISWQASKASKQGRPRRPAAQPPHQTQLAPSGPSARPGLSCGLRHTLSWYQTTIRSGPPDRTRGPRACFRVPAATRHDGARAPPSESGSTCPLAGAQAAHGCLSTSPRGGQGRGSPGGTPRPA